MARASATFGALGGAYEERICRRQPRTEQSAALVGVEVEPKISPILLNPM
jgi:hypothetical protein